MTSSATAAASRPTIRPDDLLGVDQFLSDEERDIRDTVRAFVRDRVLPNVGEWFEQATIPRELASELGRLGVLGMHLEGYGCAGASATAAAWLPYECSVDPRVLTPAVLAGAEREGVERSGAPERVGTSTRKDEGLRAIGAFRRSCGAP